MKNKKLLVNLVIIMIFCSMSIVKAEQNSVTFYNYKDIDAAYEQDNLGMSRQEYRQMMQTHPEFLNAVKERAKEKAEQEQKAQDIKKQSQPQIQPQKPQRSYWDF